MIVNPGVIASELSVATVGCTVIVAVPATLTAPAVASAEMVAVPTASAVTSPDADTAAIVGAVDNQTTVAAMAAPLSLRGDAVSCDVWPTLSVVVPATATVVSTGRAVTVTAIVPTTVDVPATAVAVIVAVPGPTAETRPLDDTVATFAAEVLQLTVAVICEPD